MRMRADPHQRYRVINETRGTLVAAQVEIASSWWARGKGLLGRRELPAEHGLFIPQCQSIHTWGMQFAIDAVFVDKAWRIVALHQQVGPWRLTQPHWKAWGVLEIPAGTGAKIGLQTGDQLRLVATENTPPQP